MNAAHAQSTQDLFQELASDSQGLSSQEADTRLLSAGPNRLPEAAPPSRLRILFNQFKSFLIYVLCFAVVLSFLLEE